MFTEIDEEILHAINQGLSSAILDMILVTLTVLGRWCCLVLLSVPFWFGRQRKIALCFAMLIAATDVSVLGLKFVIGRPRPTGVILPLPQSSFPSFPSGHAACSFAGASFLYFCLRARKHPSLRGRDADASHGAVEGVQTSNDDRPRVSAAETPMHLEAAPLTEAQTLPRNHLLMLSLFTMASLIAFSRVYLGQHYPSDVVAGAIVGFLIGSASAHLLARKKV